MNKTVENFNRKWGGYEEDTPIAVEWEDDLADLENEIRADERKKCGEELLKVINEKPYGTEKNDWWLISQIKHFCFGVPRICDKKE